MNSNEPIRIAQLSDTHFLAEGEEAEGGFAYNTDEAFAAVRDHLAAQPNHDLVVVTGDIADHGRQAQYQQAAAAFAQLNTAVNVCPGNHDQDAVFTANMGRLSIGTSRVIERGSWCFLFVDSNAGVLVPDESGRMVDPEVYEDRLHHNGGLGPREAAWIRDMCETTAADNVFVWLHHPPAVEGLGADVDYTNEWRSLLSDLAIIKGIGGGHTHMPNAFEFEGRPIVVCPSFKNNFDLQTETLLPPGYRSFEFHDDGTFTHQVHLCDDDRWPRHPLGRAVMALLRGELSYDEFAEISARKARD